MSRLAQGGRIDRGRAVSFQFDGRVLHGFAGDSLASALLANEVHLVGRSFKYHRPRGILGAGVEEPNALVDLDRGPGRREPNRPATVTPLHEGLRARSQNAWPSLKTDLGALNGLIAPFIPAGFYYKTFMWPRWGWRTAYEPRIRAMAGLGVAPTSPDPDTYASRWAHCEVLIVGAGPAGLAAALAAARSGKRVILCDQDEAFGGALLSDPSATIDGFSAWDWLRRAEAALAAFANVRLMPHTTAFAYTLHNMVVLAERLTDHLPAGAPGPRERQWLVRAREVVLATGAIERPLVFPGNDRPGVMLASAVRTYVNRYAVLPGRRAVVALQHDSGYQAAFDLAAAGGAVAAIVDLRAHAPADLLDRARTLAIPVMTEQAPSAARGRGRIRSVRISPLGQRSAKEEGRWIDCDLLMMAGGWTPTVHLFSQSRGRLEWREDLQAFTPAQAAQAQVSAGACGGTMSLEGALRQGALAGAQAAGLDDAVPPVAAPERADVGEAVNDTARFGRAAGKAFVDFQNDVTAKDIALAVREGFRSIEHIKRYTTNGMATDQGRTSNLNALAIAADALGKPAPAIGLTTFRAPFTPVTFGTLAGYARGPLFDPVRHTPLHDQAVAHGAVFEDVGQWKRARYFPAPGEDMDAAVRRECEGVRARAGLCDASTLGKIEVVGPDAAAFLDLIYANGISTLKIGRCRYGVMLREDGFILDDGIVGRLADHRFHVTTTTSGVDGVLHMMEDFRQTEWPHLKVWLTNTTEQWATLVINGPRAREIVAPLIGGVDLDRDAFPHMAVRTGTICGAPGRIFRVSFTGELGFELNVPASHAQTVWDALLEAGRPYGMTLYGTEAMHVLRAEKGYLIIGQETDGTVTLDDVGLGRMVGEAKADFVGKRSLDRAAMTDPLRKQLVGLLTADGRTVLEEGAQLIEQAGGGSLGHVTSAYWSVALGQPVALAHLSGGRSRIGGGIRIAGTGGLIDAKVVSPVFIDPEGVRVNG